ncbi:hypothetical protein CO661_11835 [Sinorhizobium fredii]|uniref:Uncharacterized protein n=1 Tax=Rhizobium fredii TaxID=380 RepID=A0A2A6LZ65_RHIFR|nr:hypothetical protein CO661_11835 [Sinorhizobium fredii]
MSLTTQFIAELVRAANEADRLTRFEVKRLLNRSIGTIRDIRKQTGIPGSSRAKDVEFIFGWLRPGVREA